MKKHKDVLAHFELAMVYFITKVVFIFLCTNCTWFTLAGNERGNVFIKVMYMLVLGSFVV